jgi:glycosyltransferase involved in cell wall biosynthesis
MSQPIQISLIIPAHNEEKYIGACLDSVIENSRGRFIEVIVIDNASTDGTTEIAQKRPGVQIIREHRKGITHARERGRLEGTGEFLAYIDADCRLPKIWLDVVDQLFTEQPDAVSLSGAAIYFDASAWQRLVLGTFWRISAPLIYYLVGYMVYGAHFVVKKSALDAIGGFNRKIPFYGEDTDLARRLSTMGKVVFRMNFRILTSARRFAAEGILKTNARYALNYLWLVLFNRPFSTSYRDVR